MRRCKQSRACSVRLAGPRCACSLTLPWVSEGKEGSREPAATAAPVWKGSAQESAKDSSLTSFRVLLPETWRVLNYNICLIPSVLKQLSLESSSELGPRWWLSKELKIIDEQRICTCFAN